MEAVGAAASIVQLADAGLKISIKLFTFAETVRDAEKIVKRISADISVTCGILTQLTELVQPKDSSGSVHTALSDEGLKQVELATDICRTVFDQLQSVVEGASKQLSNKNPSGQKIKLSTSEKAKWPFLQPRIQELRTELFNAKSNLMVVLLIAQLANAEKLTSQNKSSSLPLEQQQRFRAAVLAIRRLEKRPVGDPAGNNTTHIPGAWRSSLYGTPRSAGSATELGPKTDILGKGKATLIASARSASKSDSDGDDSHRGTVQSTLDGVSKAIRIVQSAESIPAGSDSGVPEEGDEPSRSSVETQMIAPASVTFAPDNKAKLPEKSGPEISAPSTRSTPWHVRKIFGRLHRKQSTVTKRTNSRNESTSIEVGHPSRPAEAEMLAWTTSVIPTYTGGDCEIEALPVSEDAIVQYLEQLGKQSASVLEQVNKLNVQQRKLVLDHIREKGLTLVSVGELGHQKLVTVFGDIRITTLVWITKRVSSGAGKIRDGTWLIFVKTLTGKTIQLSVRATMTIDQVKKLIEESE
ncbi:MAG: hypothetical protein M1840_005903, partial [Geoglossum simile]